MSINYTGIDIGTCYIKIAEIKLDRTGIAINNPSVFKTPGMLVQGGRLAAGDELLKIFGGALPRNGRHSKKCVVILNDSLAVTRDMELPSGKPEELAKMVRLSASEYLPFNIEQYTIRYKTLVPDKANPKKNNYILMSAAKNDLVMDFIGVLNRAGLKCKAIDVSFNCMAKYLRRAYFARENSDRKNTAFLDLGAGGARLIITKNGAPFLHQVLNYSSQKLDVIISNALDVDKDTAEEKKIQYGLSQVYTELQDEAYRRAGILVSQQIDLLMGDLYKSFQSFTARNNGEAVNEIRISGGMAGLKCLDRYFHEAFNLPCNIETPKKDILFENDACTNTDYPLFTNLIGAALRGD